MSVTAAVNKRDKSNGAVTAVFRLAVAGNYSVTESLDFALLIGWTNKQPDSVRIQGNSGFIYSYDRANKYFKVFGQNPTSVTAGVIGLSELTAGAYPAGITGDTIEAIVTWLRG